MISLLSLNTFYFTLKLAISNIYYRVVAFTFSVHFQFNPLIFVIPAKRPLGYKYHHLKTVMYIEKIYVETSVEPNFQTIDIWRMHWTSNILTKFDNLVGNLTFRLRTQVCDITICWAIICGSYTRSFFCAHVCPILWLFITIIWWSKCAPWLYIWHSHTNPQDHTNTHLWRTKSSPTCIVDLRKVLYSYIIIIIKYYYDNIAYTYTYINHILSYDSSKHLTV